MKNPHAKKPLRIVTAYEFFELDAETSNKDVTQAEAVGIQIRLAIENHLDKQYEMLDAGRKIKALTLFFIDAVKMVRDDDREDIDRGITQILEGKNELISFNTPLAFILSHSALREGWDKPNIFTLCTLKNSTNVIAKNRRSGGGSVCLWTSMDSASRMTKSMS